MTTCCTGPTDSTPCWPRRTSLVGSGRAPAPRAPPTRLPGPDGPAPLRAGGAVARGGRRLRCHGARRIQFAGDQLAPYESWPLASDTRLTARNFATGVGGVLYVPELIDALAEAGDGFRE